MLLEDTNFLKWNWPRQKLMRSRTAAVLRRRFCMGQDTKPQPNPWAYFIQNSLYITREHLSILHMFQSERSSN